MNYKSYFDNFVQKIEKELEQKQLYENRIDELNTRHEEQMKKLDIIINRLNSQQDNNALFLDNNQFIKLMNISKRTAQQWRDTNTIAYSQIGNKIFYQISDIQDLLKANYIKAKKGVF